MSAQIQESWPIHKTMVDGITERLRHAIIVGTIGPGERIRVADLERKFGASHIPIREALRRQHRKALSKFHRGEQLLQLAWT
jgi:DNA-binding GntR family transcriptional regulator